MDTESKCSVVSAVVVTNHTTFIYTQLLSEQYNSLCFVCLMFSQWLVYSACFGVAVWMVDGDAVRVPAAMIEQVSICNV
jgi:hypothetical protein